jgi:hypothetical protein
MISKHIKNNEKNNDLLMGEEIHENNEKKLSIYREKNPGLINFDWLMKT